MFIEINGLAYNLMFTQSIDKLYEDGKYKILYAISNENKLVEEFDNEADRDAKYEKAQAVGGASKEEIEHIEYEIEHLKEVGFHPLKVDELPTADIKDYILYLVPSDKPGEDNLCYEYLYINNAWEMVGTTSVDLSNYYTKSETDNKLNEKQNTLTAGENITIDENNVISGGKTNYLGYIEDYTPDNRLDITDLEKGTYSLGIKDRIESQTLYLKVSHNGQEQILDTKLQIEATVVSNMIYFDVRNPIKHMSGYDEVIRIGLLYLNNNTGEIVNTKYGISYDSTNGKLSNSARYNEEISAVTTDTTQVISGKKTFNVLPESSVEPTNVNQFVNKKYVDDSLKNVKPDDVTSIYHLKLSASKSILEPNQTIDITAENELQELSNIITKAFSKKGFSLYISTTVTSSYYRDPAIFHINHVDLSSHPTRITGDGQKIYRNISHSYMTYLSSAIVINGTWDGDVFTASNASINGASSITQLPTTTNVLTIDNTSSFTPTKDYHPATKKYVDASISSAITDALGGSY